MKRSFFFFIACLSVFGCNKMDIPSTEPAYPEESRLEHVISIAEAVRSDIVSTKGKPVLVDRDKIYYITAPSTKASAMDADTLMYILNYEEDAGFAVIPYMDGIADYVCVTQNGFYDGSETGIWGFDEYMRQITAQISAYDPDLIDRSMKDEENVMTKAASTTTKEVEPIIPVEWHQDAPFNWYCSEPYNSLVPAGCVAVSIAQAMTVFKYPQNIQLTYPGARQNSLYLDWDSMLDHEYGPCLERLCITCNAKAHLLREIGERVDMIYREGGSAASVQEKGKECLSSFGYQSNDVVSFNISDIEESLDAGYPIIIRGQNDASGHAWNVDGYYYSRTLNRMADISGFITGTRTVETWYLDFKYGQFSGSNNGRYLTYQKIVATGSYTATGNTVTEIPVSIFNDDMNSNVKIITNIHPL